MVRLKILDKDKINIPKMLIFTKDEYDLFEDKEAEIKRRFIEILRLNQSKKTVIRLVDLKNKYSDLLDTSIQKDKKFIQIMKNAIASKTC